METGNVIEGNLGMLTRASYALLNTDTTPATFWITHPNNTVRRNAAAGEQESGWGGWECLQCGGIWERLGKADWHRRLATWIAHRSA